MIVSKEHDSESSKMTSQISMVYVIYLNKGGPCIIIEQYHTISYGNQMSSLH